MIVGYAIVRPHPDKYQRRIVRMYQQITAARGMRTRMNRQGYGPVVIIPLNLAEEPIE